MIAKPKKFARAKSPAIERDDQLGNVKAVAKYMGVSRTWICGVKRRYLELVGQMQSGELKVELPASPFAGGKTCAAWVRDFVRHPINASFVPTRSYQTALNPRSPHISTPPSPHADPAVSASGKSG